MERKVVLYIAMSLDGYIAQPDDNLGFLELVQKEGEDYGYHDFIQSVDTVVLGRKTYDWVMTQVVEFPHADKECFVITHTPRPSIGKTSFHTGDLRQLIVTLKKQTGKTIFIDGGAAVVNELLKHKLIDEYILSVIPVLLGAGTRLFKDDTPIRELQLVSSKHFDTGLVQLHYQNNTAN